MIRKIKEDIMDHEKAKMNLFKKMDRDFKHAVLDFDKTNSSKKSLRQCLIDLDLWI